MNSKHIIPSGPRPSETDKLFYDALSFKLSSNHIIPSGPRPSETDKLFYDALSGDPESQVQLGYNYRKSGDIDEAEKWFFKALEQGFNYAHFQIGLLKYAEAMKTNYDPKLAWEHSYPWYVKGADGGCFHCKDKLDNHIDDLIIIMDARRKNLEDKTDQEDKKSKNEVNSPGKIFFELILTVIGIVLMSAVGTLLLSGAIFINSITIPLLIVGFIIYKIYCYFSGKRIQKS